MIELFEVTRFDQIGFQAVVRTANRFAHKHFQIYIEYDETGHFGRHISNCREENF